MVKSCCNGNLLTCVVFSYCDFFFDFFIKKKFNPDLPRAISRSDSANANLSVNLSSVLRVRSRAEAEAPSRAARMARMSSARDEAFEGRLTW